MTETVVRHNSCLPRGNPRSVLGPQATPMDVLHVLNGPCNVLSDLKINQKRPEPVSCPSPSQLNMINYSRFMFLTHGYFGLRVI